MSMHIFQVKKSACYSQGSPDCDRALGITACKALNLTNPETPLPQHCDLLMNKVSIVHNKTQLLTLCSVLPL